MNMEPAGSRWTVSDVSGDYLLFLYLEPKKNCIVRYSRRNRCLLIEVKRMVLNIQLIFMMAY